MSKILAGWGLNKILGLDARIISGNRVETDFSHRNMALKKGNTLKAKNKKKKKINYKILIVK